MKRHVRLSERAIQDIEDVYAFLSMSSEQTPGEFVEAVRRTTDMLADYPGLGKPWQHGERNLPGLRSVRIRGFAAWLLLYVDERHCVRVIRVVHGSRELSRILKPE